MNKPLIHSSKIRNVKFGRNVTYVEPCNLYDCQIGENSFIGPFVEIQSSAIIGKECKIQSHSFVCSKVIIGNNCFVGHGVFFTNDLFKSGNPSSNEKNWLSTYIEDNVSIGSGVTILPVKIIAGCVVGAGSVVTKNLEIKGIYAGNPAKLIREI